VPLEAVGALWVVAFVPGIRARQINANKKWKRKFAEMHGFCDKIRALKH